MNWNKDDLEFGICSVCGEESHEIAIEYGKCIHCIEEETFYETLILQKINDSIFNATF